MILSPGLNVCRACVNEILNLNLINRSFVSKAKEGRHIRFYFFFILRYSFISAGQLETAHCKERVLLLE